MDEKPIFDAAAARAASYVDPQVGLSSALERIEQSAKKGWTEVRLDGPGWREASENGDALRAELVALGYTADFLPAERVTAVKW